MTAVQRATSTPRRHARRAARPTVAISRSSAPLALTVRNAPSERSSTDPMPPTAACDRSVARRIRGTTTSTASPLTARTASVTPSSSGSSRAIRTTAADQQEGRVDRLDQPVGADAAQQRGVGDHPGQQVARAQPVQRAHPQSQQLGDQPLPGGQDDALRGPARARRSRRRSAAAPTDISARSAAPPGPAVTACPPSVSTTSLASSGWASAGQAAEEAEQPAAEQRPAVGPDVGQQQAPGGLPAAAPATAGTAHRRAVPAFDERHRRSSGLTAP